MNEKFIRFVYACAVFMALGVGSYQAIASDHDDGESDVKARALNLTDLYVFREDWHTNSSSDNDKLVFIMNSNPRSIPKQQYFFSTQAKYQFHIKTVADKTAAYTSGEDYTLTFQFAAPDSSSVQAITVTSLAGTTSTEAKANADGTTIKTTALGSSDYTNSFTLGGVSMRLFAGLKEDPFFFDVSQYFKVRAGIASTGGASLPTGFKSTSAAVDFAAGYNVNGIVLEVPLTYFGGGNPTLDVWETISIPQ
jgi:hypothetical protein